MEEDLAEVVGVPREVEEALVADGLTLGMGLAEAELLNVADTLHDESYGEEDDAHDVPGGAEGVLGVARDGGRVEDGDGQRDGPNPEHLKDPEAEEGEELVPLVIEAVVLARFEDAEEEEAGESGAPDHHEEGDDDLASMGVAAHGEGDDGEDDEVGASCEVCAED